MAIVGLLIQLFFILLIAYFVVKYLKKQSIIGGVKEKKENLDLERQAFKEVASDISNENVEMVKRDRDGLKKFNSL